MFGLVDSLPGYLGQAHTHVLPLFRLETRRQVVQLMVHAVTCHILRPNSFNLASSDRLAGAAPPVVLPQGNTYTPVALSEPANGTIDMRSYADRDREQYAAMNEETGAMNPSSSDALAWQEKEPRPRSKFWLWGTVAVIAAAAIAGIVAGVLLSQHKSSSSSTVPGGSSGTNSSSSNPSSFTKNPALKNSFYGFAYTPIVRFSTSSLSLCLVY